ncbi:MAG: hypothetical protein L0G59_11155, partial [Kocuria sp.]|nr:hypothetical protein [Kocuria sp.]
MTENFDEYQEKYLGGADAEDEVEEHLANLDDEEAEKRAEALRAGLDEYELEDEDRELLVDWGFDI